MTSKRIFITGGSGCIGHYLAELLIEQTPHELFFLVRNRAKVQFDVEIRAGIHLIEGDMREIERHTQLLQTIDIAILAANAWGGAQEVFDVNVVKTIRLLKLLNAQQCKQVFYFSTASILNRENQPLAEAKQLGTEYIRSKYDCLSQLQRLDIAPKITVLFPTLVFGGSQTKPYSHLSGGLPDIVRWVGLIRFFKAEASFHYLHARDIAQVVTYLVDHPLPYQIINELEGIYVKQLVLGNPAIQVNEAIAEVCAYFGQRIWFQIEVSKWLANFLIRLFHIQMGAWDRFCMDYRHFTYENPVNPETFGLTTVCPTLNDIFLATGIRGKKQSSLSTPPRATALTPPSPAPTDDVTQPEPIPSASTTAPQKEEAAPFSLRLEHNPSSANPPSDSEE
ncbi:MAG: NAD-dependent epimerase/dehydratase family protein [Spirulina sp. SIO3F2]|nr:NAD-dependent epimerase/dehydratase family protein [Spirulina sp. SIO3F2]